MSTAGWPPRYPPLNVTAPPSRKSLAKRIGVVAASLVLAAAAFGLLPLLPTPADVFHPFVVAGAREREVDGGSFTVKTVDPIFTERLRYSDGLDERPREVRTTGVWMLVPVALTASEQPVMVQGAELRTDAGRSYVPSRRLPYTHDPSAQSIEPGIRKIGVWAFEIRPQDVAGATLYLSENPNPELTPQVRIPLGVDAEDARSPERRFDVPEVTISQ